MSLSSTTHQCNVCSKPAKKRCSRCSTVWYCTQECQKQDWKTGTHKRFCDSEYQMHQYELHKKAFDALVQKYSLQTEEKSSEIAEFLTSNNNNSEDAVTAPDFAKKFGMDVEEAVVFLEWIKTGVRFKEQAVDTAKKAGISSQADIDNAVTSTTTER